MMTTPVVFAGPWPEEARLLLAGRLRALPSWLGGGVSAGWTCVCDAGPKDMVFLVMHSAWERAVAGRSADELFCRLDERLASERRRRQRLEVRCRGAG